MMASEIGFNNKRRALKPVVPEILTSGTPLWRWDRDDQMGIPLIFKVDPDGFYLYARGDKSKEALYWDLCQISDVRIAEKSSDALKEKLSRKESNMKDRLGRRESAPRERPGRKESVDRAKAFKRDYFGDDEDDDDEVKDSILHLVYKKDGITSLEFITLVAQNSELANEWMVAVNTLTHNLYHMNCSMSDMVKKMKVKVSLHANGYGQLQLKTIDRVLTGKSKTRMESIKFSLEVHKVPIMQCGDDCYIEVDKLTDEIVEDMISRVANCNELVQAVFVEQGCKVPNMDEIKLLRFLNKVQRDPRDNEVINEYHKKTKATEIIHTLEPNGSEIGKLTPVGMWRFLASEESNLVDKTQLGLVMDMSQPLSHYYINSSHNTYCAGAQINGQSSVEIYRQCLLQGCRCVELDCWVQNDDIIITHGFMSGVWVCTTVSFEKVLQAIRDFAFVTTDYPLILSIENHVDKPHLLSRMAFLYTITFGERLLKEPLEGYPLEPGVPLPSPELLKGKILLKDKIKLKKLKELEVCPVSEGQGAVCPMNPALLNGAVMGMKRRTQSDSAVDFNVANTSSSSSSSSSSDDEDTANGTPEVNGDDNTSDNDVENTSKKPTGEIMMLDSATGQRMNQFPLDGSNPHKRGKMMAMKSLSSIDENETAEFSSEENWIVPDFSTLPRPRDKKRGAITMLPDLTKEQDSDDTLTPDSSEEALRNMQLRRVSEGMALVGGPLVDMLNYCTAAKFEGFEAAEKRDHWNYVSSMDEDKALQNLSDYPVEFAKYNARQFSRIYPAGKRINSSNYLPDWYWSAGCQIIALNYQTPDLPMQLNYGKFEQNLKCGYVLKPSVLRNAKMIPFNMFDQRFENIVPSTITIKILSGLFLSERLNMVDIEMFGLPVDTLRKGVMKTHYQVGPHPKWDNHDEKFEFKQVFLPEMCSLRFSVTDDKGDLIGQRILPLSMIRSGYRFVTLRDKHSQPLLLTSLFVFVRIENYIPDHLKDYVCDLQRPPKRIVDDDGKNPNSLSKVLKSRTTLTTLMIDDDLPTQVKKRNIPAIKPGELVVTNSKRMLKFNKRAEKECGILERNYKTRLSQAKSKPGLLLRRSRSLEPVAPKKDFDAVKLELEAKYRQEMRELQIRLTEERYKETASVLYLLHEEQKKTMSKIHDKELATYQKTVISGYYDQISAKKGNQKKKMGEASMKHIRLEVAKKCTEKIQQLKDLHAEELKRLATTQSKLQEQLRSDKEQDLNRYQSAQH